MPPALAQLAPVWGGPPPVFDDFEVLRTLGAGGMGTVYVARDRRLGRLWRSSSP